MLSVPRQRCGWNGPAETDDVDPAATEHFTKCVEQTDPDTTRGDARICPGCDGTGVYWIPDDPDQRRGDPPACRECGGVGVRRVRDEPVASGTLHAEEAMPGLFALVADAVFRIAPRHLAKAAHAHTSVEDWYAAADAVAEEAVASYRLGELAPASKGSFGGLTRLGYADGTVRVVERPPFGWTNGNDWWHTSQVDVAAGVAEPECWLDALAPTGADAADLDDEAVARLSETLGEYLGDARVAQNLAEAIVDEYTVAERTFTRASEARHD